MAVADNIHSIDSLIGMTIISRATGNKLGQVQDLVVDPIKGLLLGLTVKMSDGKTQCARLSRGLQLRSPDRGDGLTADDV